MKLIYSFFPALARILCKKFLIVMKIIFYIKKFFFLIVLKIPSQPSFKNFLGEWA